MRPASMRPDNAPIRPWRSISSRSPPAVGNISTGRPVMPQRTTRAGQRQALRLPREPVFLHVVLPMPPRGPHSRATAGSRPKNCSVNVSTSCAGKSAVTFLRTAPRRVAAEELPGDLVEVRQVPRAELLEPLRLETLARDCGVGAAASRGAAGPRRRSRSTAPSRGCGASCARVAAQKSDQRRLALTSQGKW